jgi:general secretion pathway protein K
MLLPLFKNNRGIALFITLVIITVLFVVALELSRKARSAVISTGLTRDRLTVFHMASSGIQAGISMLIKDRIESDFDSIQEDWANPEKISEILKDIPFDSGQVNLKINDELGKIQVNALVSFPEGRKIVPHQQQLWNRFLEQFTPPDTDAEDMKPTAIIHSIKDWLDSGDDDAITGLQGAESDYYQSLETPYPCKNGPLDHLGELALIKGITPDLFDEIESAPEIAKYITTYGITDLGGNQFTYRGKININTADLPVIAAILPPEAKDLAQAIYEYRQENEDSKYMHDLSSPTWYNEAPGSSSIDIDTKLITNASDIFSLEATATLNTMKTTVNAVVQREKDGSTGQWRCKILNWKAK